MPPEEQRIGTLVKVCGIRTPDHARRVLEAGADAVGVVVAPGSPRRVTPAEAREIAAAAGNRAVLVMIGGQPITDGLIGDWPGPVQIHQPTADPGRRYILAGPWDMPEVSSAWSGPTARLLDAPRAGSGVPWDWRRPARHASIPLIIAGGLEASNVGAAIEATQPWAVDVSSGVERERGLKDFALIEAFLIAVRDADRRLGRTRPCSPPGFAALA